MITHKLTKATLATVRKYGFEVCLRAYKLWAEGNGASTASLLVNGRISTGDAIINAGREIVTGSRKP